MVKKVAVETQEFQDVAYATRGCPMNSSTISFAELMHGLWHMK